MSQENVEVARRSLEEPFPEGVTLKEMVAWVAGFWESDGDYYPVRKFPRRGPATDTRKSRDS
jgi:hypothetical protein